MKNTEMNQSDTKTIFHCVNEKKLVAILKKNEIKPRWKHFIEAENRLVTGTCFTWELDHSTLVNMEYPVKLIFDKEKLEKDYPYFLINSLRIHLQTMAITKPDLYDPTAYTFEDETPDEMFVEGIIKPLSDYLLAIEILKPISAESILIVDTYKKTVLKK
jgi:hypothetical protein